MSQSAQVAIWITIMVGAVTAVFQMGRVLWRGFSKMVRLADDMLGEPANGVKPARPSVVDRLNRIEEQLNIVESIEVRVSTNEGRISELELHFRALADRLAEPTQGARHVDP